LELSITEVLKHSTK